MDVLQSCLDKFPSPFVYSIRQFLTFGQVMDFSFSQFSPFCKRDLETNDTLFKSPKIEPFESGEKLILAMLT